MGGVKGWGGRTTSLYLVGGIVGLAATLGIGGLIYIMKKQADRSAEHFQHVYQSLPAELREYDFNRNRSFNLDELTKFHRDYEIKKK